MTLHCDGRRSLRQGLGWGAGAIQVSVRHPLRCSAQHLPSRQLRLTAAILEIYRLPLGTRKGEVATGAVETKAVDHSRKVLTVTG